MILVKKGFELGALFSIPRLFDILADSKEGRQEAKPRDIVRQVMDI